ncbi:MAG: hypothetical protein KGH75_00810 [Rhodospirillales bacterium]|nr:hypothetical protein [Rhodospirillales bacterium]
MMPAACTICIHPQREAIDRAIRIADPIRRIADRFGVSLGAISRHRRHIVVGDPDRASLVHARDGRRSQGQNIPRKIKPGVQAAFLAAFVELANEAGARRVAQIDRATVIWWEEHDPTFSMRYHAAQADVNDALRGEMFRRAVYGVPEPVVSSGKLIRNDDGTPMTVQKYSDPLIVKLATARMPEFREKQQVEMSGKDGGPIQIAQSVRGLTDQELAAMKAMLEAAVARHGDTASPPDG